MHLWPIPKMATAIFLIPEILELSLLIKWGLYLLETGSDFVTAQMNKTSFFKMTCYDFQGKVIKGGMPVFLSLSKCFPWEPSHHVVRKPGHMARPRVGVLAHIPAKVSTTSQHQSPTINCLMCSWVMPLGDACAQHSGAPVAVRVEQRQAGTSKLCPKCRFIRKIIVLLT